MVNIIAYGKLTGVPLNILSSLYEGERLLGVQTQLFSGVIGLGLIQSLSYLFSCTNQFNAKMYKNVGLTQPGISPNLGTKTTVSLKWFFKQPKHVLKFLDKNIIKVLFFKSFLLWTYDV